MVIKEVSEEEEVDTVGDAVLRCPLSVGGIWASPVCFHQRPVPQRVFSESQAGLQVDPRTLGPDE